MLDHRFRRRLRQKVSCTNVTNSTLSDLKIILTDSHNTECNVVWITAHPLYTLVERTADRSGVDRRWFHYITVGKPVSSLTVPLHSHDRPHWFDPERPLHWSPVYDYQHETSCFSWLSYLYPVQGKEKKNNTNHISCKNNRWLLEACFILNYLIPCKVERFLT